MTIAFTVLACGAVSLKSAKIRHAAEKTLFLPAFVALLRQ
jgi:hypothetical protein